MVFFFLNKTRTIKSKKVQIPEQTIQEKPRLERDNEIIIGVVGEPTRGGRGNHQLKREREKRGGN